MSSNFYNFLEQRNKIVVSRNIEQLLEGFLNYKLVHVILKLLKIDKSKTWNNLSEKEKISLVEKLQSFNLNIIGTNDFDKAQVCSGGIPLTEINMNSELTYIGAYSFLGCKQLTDIGKQECLEYVGNDAFWASGLTKFESNENVKFGRAVFWDTPFLFNTDQYINNGVLMKYTYEGEKNYLVLPEGITSIEQNK